MSDVRRPADVVMLRRTHVKEVAMADIVTKARKRTLTTSG